MASKKKRARGYDEPRPGYVRWCTYVDIKLLEAFKKVAIKENKSFMDAVKEALENWTYAEEE